MTLSLPFGRTASIQDADGAGDALAAEARLRTLVIEPTGDLDWRERGRLQLSDGRQRFQGGEVAAVGAFLSALDHLLPGLVAALRLRRQGVLDAALNLFGEESVAVMWKDVSGLSETELADLGFCKIAGSELIYRHSALRTRFGDEHPTGQDATDAVAEPEHEEWVMQAWKRFEDGVLP